MIRRPDVVIRRTITRTNELASALRDIGRRFKQGVPTDNPALGGLVAEWSEKRPMDGVRLQSLLVAAQEDTAREDRQSALQHYRAAIEFVCECDKLGRA